MVRRGNEKSHAYPAKEKSRGGEATPLFGRLSAG